MYTSRVLANAAHHCFSQLYSKATMDPILRGCRLGFDLGDIEFATANAMVSKSRRVYLLSRIIPIDTPFFLSANQIYIVRIVYCGKNSELHCESLFS